MAQLPTVRPLPAEPRAVQADFIAGWFAGGGDQARLPLALEIINAESGWQINAYNAAGPYTGLGQWDSTWYAYGGGDIYSPWQQGHNMAVRVVATGGFKAWNR